MFSYKSAASSPTPDALVLRTNSFIRSGSFNTGSCSRYSLSSELSRSCASFHCTCSDFPFLRRSDSGAEIWAISASLGCGLYSSHLILGTISLASWLSDVEFSILSLGSTQSNHITYNLIT